MKAMAAKGSGDDRVGGGNSRMKITEIRSLRCLLLLMGLKKSGPGSQSTYLRDSKNNPLA